MPTQSTRRPIVVPAQHGSHSRPVDVGSTDGASGHARVPPATGLSPAASSRIAGATLLVMSVLAGFGNFVAVQGLVTAGDGGATASAILESEGMFRFGVAALYLAALLDVVIAVALFRVFAPVSLLGSRLEAWLRLAYAAVFVVAISQLAGIPDLLHDGAAAEVFTPDQVHVQVLQRVDAFHDIWFGGLLLFGAHLMVLGYLAYRSGYLPRILAVLLFLAGAGYAFDTLSDLLSQGEGITVSGVTFVGEFLLAVWLLVRARRIASRVVDDAI